jgi:hypothetical protein
MRGVIIRSLAVIGVGGVVLAGVLYVASTVDARPPEVLAISVTQPVADDPQLALINTSIEVAFSEPVEPASATDALRIAPAVEGTTSWSGSTLIFTPADPLELETSYVVEVDPSVRDLNGNRMEESPEPFAFVTAGRPTLVEAEPADGSDEVPLDAAIRLVFSTLMDTASVEAELRIEPALAHELRWSGEALEIVPTEPLEPDRDYRVTIGADAADAAGVALGEGAGIAFRTVAAGLTIQTVIPADGVDGIAAATAIALVFDRPIDPDSLDPAMLVIEPDVAGTLEVVPLPGEVLAGDDAEGSGRMLRFTPSGPLPPNTTFAVELGPGLTATSGGELAEATSWTFTTGAPASTISNQITFLTDRAGIPNVWAMNPDGTGQRQLSAELSAVVDYAIAPDGSSLVVGDGRRLVFLRTDTGERRVLTEEGTWEFDPAFAPNGQVLAFGRADAETGEGLGLWSWEVGGGAPTSIEIPDDLLDGDDDDRDDEASASPDPDAPGLLRAPRFAPDGQALAFVDAEGSVGILELPAARFTRIAFRAAAPPSWLPDASAILVTGVADGALDAPSVEAPVLPLRPGDEDEPFRIGRSATEIDETVFASGWHVLAISPSGLIAFADANGRLGLTDSLETVGPERLLDGDPVVDVAFAPGEESLAVAVRIASDATRIDGVELANERREPLAEAGERPRWQP